MPDFSGPAPSTRQSGMEPLALMDAFEANYHCLLALCPALREARLQGRCYQADTPPGMPRLELEVHEHTKYTVTFTLACRPHSRIEELPMPNVQVRLYWDSKQAELLGYEGRLQFLNRRQGMHSTTNGAAAGPIATVSCTAGCGIVSSVATIFLARPTPRREPSRLPSLRP